MKCLSCFSSSSSSSSSPPPSSNALHDLPLPNVFSCPISGRLMADPAIIMPTGHVVELACFQACKDLNYIPSSLSLSASSSIQYPRDLSSFTTFPYNSLKSTIVFWCDSIGRCPPLPVCQQEARSIVQRLKQGGGVRIQEPTAEESSQYSRTASQPADRGVGQPSSSAAPAAAADDEDSLEHKILKNLMNPEVSAQNSGLCSLIQHAESSEEQAVSICSHGIVGGVVPLLLSDHHLIQTKASKAVEVLSQANGNRVKIVVCGAIPPLLLILTHGIWQARTNAATTFCNLTRDEGTWKDIGELCAIPPLLEKFYDGFNMSYAARKAVVLALFNLTLHPDNLTILANMGAVPKLLAMATDTKGDVAIALRKYALNLLCNLSGAKKGREDLIKEGAVSTMLQLAEEGEAMSKHCLGVLFNLRIEFRGEFRRQALAADGIAVLALMMDEWEEDGKEMARTLLAELKKKDEEQR